MKSEQIFSLRCQTEQATRPKATSQTLLRMIAHTTLSTPDYGGAGRDRTDDILLAKQALSQLSYGPLFLDASSAGGDIRRLGLRAIRRDARSGLRMLSHPNAQPLKA